MTEHRSSNQEDPDTPSRRYAARLTAPASGIVLRQKILRTELDRLSQTIEHLESDQAVIEASQAIVGARRRFVLGAGRSSAFAGLCAWDLSVGLSQVFHVDEGAIRALDVLTDVRSSDVLIVYSFRRYRSHPIVVAREFAASGGLVVAITDSDEAPIRDSAEVVVTVPTTSASVADSPTGVAAATHVITTLAIASSKGARRRLDERERLSSLLNEFTPDGRPLS